MTDSEDLLRRGRAIRSSRWLKHQLIGMLGIPPEELPLVQGGVDYWITLNLWCEQHLSPHVYEALQLQWEGKRQEAKRKAKRLLRDEARMAQLKARCADKPERCRQLEEALFKLAAHDSQEQSPGLAAELAG